MLKFRDRYFHGPNHHEPEGGSVSVFDLSTVFNVVRQQWPLVACMLALGLCLALIYLAMATPKYMASARIMIDTRKNQLLHEQQVLGEQQVDAGVIESQVEILNSPGIALTVIRDQKLGDDPEFVSVSKGWFSSLFESGPDDARAPIEKDRNNAALAKFASSATAKRIGLTYVIQIDFTSTSPTKAARIANGIVDAYLLNELDIKYQGAKRASKWLMDRLAELKLQATSDEKAVQVFKADNNIIESDRGLISEQQMSDVNSQLILARALTAETKARWDRIEDILKRNDLPDATVSDALRNDVITRLRAQYLDLSGREADLARRYGVNHSAAQLLRNQMSEIRRSILSEMSRIGQTFQSDYEIARAREQSLQRSFDELVSQKTTGGDARIVLRDLESSAQTSRNLYDSFLQKFLEATQQQTSPISGASIVARALAPSGPTSPKTLLVIAGGLLAGGLTGVGWAVGRAMVSQNFHTAADVERVTGFECLGILPTVADKRGPGRPGTGNDEFSANSDVVRYAIQHPFSRFTETLRNVKVSADITRLNRDVKTIGIVSSQPREGKSTVAVNLAQIIAESGVSTLLIDADLRNPSLTRSLAPDARYGLLDVLAQRQSLAEAVRSDLVPGLHFLPAGASGPRSSPSEILSSAAMARLLAEAREHYGYILLDFAPIGPVVDVKAASHLVDGFVFVVEWGKTSHKAVIEGLWTVSNFQERLLGIVLNGADRRVLKRHENYKGGNYHDYHVEGEEKRPGAWLRLNTLFNSLRRKFRFAVVKG